MKTKSEMYAERDGIFVENVFPANRRNYRLYHIPCAKCGRIVKRKVYNGDKAYYCDICKNDLVKKEKTLEHELLNELLSKEEQRFLKAKDKLLKQVKKPEAYANAIRVAQTRANSYGSIPEAMVAIELIRLGYAIIPQQGVGRYKVDFALPNNKLVIEVDGGLYHSNVNPDRDNYIKLCLGLDWEIVHIPAEWIAKDIRRLSKVLKEVERGRD